MLVVHFRNAATQARPGADDAPARRALHARLRRRLPRRAHARRRVRRAGRGVHLHVGGDAGLRRRLAVPRPRPEPHAQHVPRRVRRDRDPRARREGARTSSTSCSCTSCCRRSRASPRAFQAINGRTFAGNTPTIEARVGQDVALHVIGMDNNFHDFHIHGHRWKDAAGAFVDTPSRGAERDDHRALRRGQSGPLAVPLPCLLAPGRGHGRLVHGEPLSRRGRRSDAIPHHGRRRAGDRAAPAGRRARAGRRATRSPKDPGKVVAPPKGKGKTLHGLQAAAASSPRSRPP